MSRMLTAEQVCEAVESNSWAETNSIREFNDSSWQAIADELNAALGCGECEQVITDCDDGLMPPFTAHCSACGAEWGFTPKALPRMRGAGHGNTRREEGGEAMSGICDTCKATRPCPAEGDGLRFCDFYNLYNRGESNYERMFGTPERAARTLTAIGGRYPCDKGAQDCETCPLNRAPCRLNRDKPEESKLLEWLRSDAE